MSSEKMKILEMIQEGKLTATEGMDLLKAIEEGNSPKEATQILEKEFVKSKGRLNWGAHAESSSGRRKNVESERECPFEPDTFRLQIASLCHELRSRG